MQTNTPLQHIPACACVSMYSVTDSECQFVNDFSFTIAARLVRVKGRTVYSVITSLVVRNTAISSLTHQLPNLTLHNSYTHRGTDIHRESVSNYTQ